MKSNLFSKQQLLTITTAVILILVLLLYLISFEVRVTQVAVVTTFGKPTSSITKPGLYWKWPYPFQDYFLFDARIQMFAGRLEQTYTADSRNVIVETYVGWKVHDPIKFLSRAGTIKNAQANLEAMLRHYSNSVISKHPFSHFVSQNIQEIQIEQIEQQIKQLLNEGDQGKTQGTNPNVGVKESLGIYVEILGIRRLELPKETTKAVMDRMKEERNRIIQSYHAQGEGKAKQIRAEAEAKRDEILIEAQAQAKRIRGEGDATAAQHYKVFEKNRELALWLRKLDSLQKILSENNRITLILDTKTSPFDLLGKSLNLQEDNKSETILPTPQQPPANGAQQNTAPQTPQQPPANGAQQNTAPQTPQQPPTNGAQQNTVPQTPQQPPANGAQQNTAPQTPQQPPADDIPTTPSNTGIYEKGN